MCETYTKKNFFLKKTKKCKFKKYFFQNKSLKLRQGLFPRRNIIFAGVAPSIKTKNLCKQEYNY